MIVVNYDDLSRLRYGRRFGGSRAMKRRSETITGGDRRAFARAARHGQA